MKGIAMDSEKLEGRNAVLEAFKSGRTIDKLYVQEGLHDEAVQRIIKEAKKNGTILSFIKKDRIDQMSESRVHQGVLAVAAAMPYATIDEMLEDASSKGEDPFIILLDEIEDPHNLGAIIRTANAAGAHGVVITKRHAATMTATVAKASAGAINYTKVAKVTNLGKEIEKLKDKGLWIAAADMDGKEMYDLDLKGPIGLVIGNEGRGVGRLIKEKCDFLAKIKMKGDIDSMNASVATGVLSSEIERQKIR